jgi:hypothetical protein
VFIHGGNVSSTVVSCQFTVASLVGSTNFDVPLVHMRHWIWDAISVIVFGLWFDIVVLFVTNIFWCHAMSCVSWSIRWHCMMISHYFFDVSFGVTCNVYVYIYVYILYVKARISFVTSLYAYVLTYTRRPWKTWRPSLEPAPFTARWTRLGWALPPWRWTRRTTLTPQMVRYFSFLVVSYDIICEK